MTPRDAASNLFKSPWWAVVALAFATGIAWAQTTARLDDLESQKAITERVMLGLGRKECRDNRIEALVIGIPCGDLERQ